MKKLMIAAAIVCAAAFAQAASYNWKSESPVYTWDSTEDAGWPVMNGATAYFVFADAYSQADLVNDFASEGGVDLTKLGATGGTTTVADDGTIATTPASSTYTTAMPAYFVVIGDDTMFISDEVTAAYDALDASPVLFKYDQVEGVWEATVGTTGTRFDAKEGYVGAGYYTAVPEPTTGLLMLLGMAGLALRRRRA